MPEKVRSGWSNLLLLALRKNVVKGSCGESKFNITMMNDLHLHYRFHPVVIHFDCNHHNLHDKNLSTVLNLRHYRATYSIYM